MRWQKLFSDLEAQLISEDMMNFDQEVMDRTRTEMAQVSIDGRVRAGIGREIQLRHRAEGHVRGIISDVGAGWLLVEQNDSMRKAALSTLVPLSAVMAIAGLGREVAPEQTLSRAGLSFAHALRAISRDRSFVTIATDGGAIAGTIDRVGQDHLDIAVHPEDRPRMRENYETILFGAIIFVTQL